MLFSFRKSTVHRVVSLPSFVGFSSSIFSSNCLRRPSSSGIEQSKEKFNKITDAQFSESIQMATAK